MKLHSLAAALALTLIGQGAHATPTVGFQSDPAAVLVGDTFELLLAGTDFDVTADGQTINNVTGGQGFNLQFDRALLQILDVDIDPLWTFTRGNNLGIPDNTVGTLTRLAFATTPPTTDDSFNIARITFKALQAGQGEVTVTRGEIVARVDNVSGTRIVPDFDSATIQVSAVPEAQTYALMLAGLGLIGWRARRRG